MMMKRGLLAIALGCTMFAAVRAVSEADCLQLINSITPEQIDNPPEAVTQAIGSCYQDNPPALTATQQCCDILNVFLGENSPGYGCACYENVVSRVEQLIASDPRAAAVEATGLGEREVTDLANRCGIANYVTSAGECRRIVGS